MCTQTQKTPCECNLQSGGAHPNFLVQLHDLFDSGERQVVVAEVRRLLHLLPLLVPEVRQLLLELLSPLRRLLLLRLHVPSTRLDDRLARRKREEAYYSTMHARWRSEPLPKHSRSRGATPLAILAQSVVVAATKRQAAAAAAAATAAYQRALLPCRARALHLSPVRPARCDTVPLKNSTIF
eukprot:COSAG02_NODE_586_length_19960_cov_13.442118_22_plen_182_part_00